MPAKNNWIDHVKITEDNFEVMEQASKFAESKKCKGKYLMQFKKFKCMD